MSAKRISSLELALQDRPAGVGLSRWLYDEFRRAILDRRLSPGTRLPATRDLANQYGISRGTVVSVFEQLESEGYLAGRPGAGTRVNSLPCRNASAKAAPVPKIRTLPAALRGLPHASPARPFRPYEPALAEFPMDVWARIASRSLRRAPTSLLAEADPRGYAPLREAIAAYLGSSRGVNCSPDQIVVVSGVQQGLDLVARALVKPGSSVWIEDPGYFGATAAFRYAGAKIIPVPLDDHGLDIFAARKLLARPKAAYVTPSHQFPLGMSMSVERRLSLLSWASEVGAFVIEDDYDSEYRFEGRPIPALQGLDKKGSVIFLGSFNKVLFPALRLGYMVLPARLLDPVLALRVSADFYPPAPIQAALCDFMTEGHLGRHIRKMREVYANRLGVLQDTARRYLAGLLDISPVRAGLSTVGFLRNGVSSRKAERAAAENGVEVLGLHRFALQGKCIDGLLMGFAAFAESEIAQAIVNLAAALERRHRSERTLVKVANSDLLTPGLSANEK
jgi:GntR family transcriptional regulator / MocR family aminotransferase